MNKGTLLDSTNEKYNSVKGSWHVKEQCSPKLCPFILKKQKLVKLALRYYFEMTAGVRGWGCERVCAGTVMHSERQAAA